jgi:hypothetical protein
MMMTDKRQRLHAALLRNILLDGEAGNAVEKGMACCVACHNGGDLCICRIYCGVTQCRATMTTLDTLGFTDAARWRPGDDQ